MLQTFTPISYNWFVWIQMKIELKLLDVQINIKMLRNLCWCIFKFLHLNLNTKINFVQKLAGNSYRIEKFPSKSTERTKFCTKFDPLGILNEFYLNFLFEIFTSEILKKFKWKIYIAKKVWSSRFFFKKNPTWHFLHKKINHLSKFFKNISSKFPTSKFYELQKSSVVQ